MVKGKISLIAAIGEQKELGLNNKLLWHIPEDLKHFQKITKGHPVIMGRKTYLSIGKPLPNRLNILVTRDRNFKADRKVVICHSLEEAIKIAQNNDKEEIFIIGGASIYKQAILLADKLYLTIVKGKYEADTYFPDYSSFKKVIFQEKKQAGEYSLTFLELLRDGP